MMSGLVVSRPFVALMTPTKPGKMSYRATFEVFSAVNHITFSMNATSGFPAWALPLSQMLAAFKYFRVLEVQAAFELTGGAASPYSVVANVSNDAVTNDANAIAILDDAYSGIGTSLAPLFIRPPRSYWREGALNWLSLLTPTSNVDMFNSNAGVISLLGSGGAVPGTVIGWCTVDIELEFHTM